MVQWLSFSRQNRKFHCEKLNCLTWQSSWCDDEMRLYHDIRSYAGVRYNKAKKQFTNLALTSVSLRLSDSSSANPLNSFSFTSFIHFSFIHPFKNDPLKWLSHIMFSSFDRLCFIIRSKNFFLVVASHRNTK